MTWSILHENCEHQIEDGVIKRCESNPEETTLVDEHGLTPLHLLCFSNPSIKALSSLLETNAKVLLQQDIHGDTPLHIALRNDQVNKDAIVMMINAFPNILSISNKEGLMPLHVCCRYCSNRSDIIDFIARSYPKACMVHIKHGNLVKSNRRIDHHHHYHHQSYMNIQTSTKQQEPKQNQDHTKQQPKHFIADMNVHSQKSNIDIKFHQYDSQIRDGSYPLHIALSNGASTDVIKILIDVGGDDVLRMKNKFDKIPIDVAQELNYGEHTLQLLRGGISLK
eukprot:334277_1